MKKFLTLALLLSAALLLSSCGTQTENASNESSSDTYAPIHIAMMAALDAVPFYIAEAQGFFEAEGLDVTLERFASGADRDAAFTATASMDGILIDALALAMYLEGGIDVVSISSTIGHAYVIGGYGRHSMDDLRGENVLIAFNTAMDYLLHVALEANGMTQSDVITQSVPSLPTRLELLLNDQAAAALIPQPLAQVAIDAGLNTITGTYELGVNPFMLGFRRDSAEEKYEEIAALLRALNAAVDYLNDYSSARDDSGHLEPSELMSLIVDLVGFPESARQMERLPVFPHFAQTYPFYIDDVFEFARYRGLLTLDISAADVIFSQ